MKVLIVGDPARYEKFDPHLPCRDQVQCIFCPRGSDNAALLSAGADAQALLLDAISPADAALIAAMPNLKLIHWPGGSTCATTPAPTPPPWPSRA